MMKVFRAWLILAAVITCFCSRSEAQFGKGALDFHTRPKAFYVNPYLTDTYYYSDSAGLIYKTVARAPLASLASKFSLDTIRDWYFSDAANGIVCGTHGMLFTNDTGSTWKPLSQMCQPYIAWEQFFYDKSTRVLYAISGTKGLWRSTDNGSTWVQMLDGNFGGIFIYDDNGILTSSNGGDCYHTTDRGQTWIKSRDHISSRRPSYDAIEGGFIAAERDGHNIWLSKDGSRWEYRCQSIYLLTGDIFLACNAWQIPFYGGYLDGRLASLEARLLRVDPNEFVYSKDDQGFRYVRNYSSFKLYLENIGMPPISLKANDLIVTIPRCSTTTRKVVVSLATKLNLANVLVRLTPLISHPAIRLIGPERRPLSETLEFQFEISGTKEGAKATYVVETDGCGDTPAVFTIYVTPSKTPSKVTAERANFGSTGMCKKQQRWVRLINADCDSIAWTSVVLTPTTTGFSIATSNFPRWIPPFQSDSVLIVLDPKVVGPLSAVTTFNYVATGGASSLTSTVQGNVSAGIAAAFGDDTLNFGAITSCKPATTMTTLKNTGCEKLRIESVALPNNSRFNIKSSPLGNWLEPDEEVQIEVEALTDQAGTFAQDIEFKAKSEAGSTTSLRVALLSDVGLPQKDHYLSEPGAITGLTTCNTIDTSVTIANLSTCQDMQVTALTFSDPAISLILPFVPSTLAPGESATYGLRLTGANGSTINDKIKLTTDLFGELTTPISATISRERLSNVEVTEPLEPFITTQCKPKTLDYSFTTHGCGYLPVKNVSVETASGASRFVLQLKNASMPLELLDGERVSFSLTYDPDRAGDDAGYIVMTDDLGLELACIPIYGITQQTNTTLGLAMQIDRTAPLTLDDKLNVTITASGVVQPDAGLTKLETELHFDRDLFTIESVTPMQNVSLQRNELPNGEKLTFASSAFNLNKDDLLASIVLKPSLSTKTASDIELAGLTLNDGDVNFTRCVMSPATTLSASTASIALDCGERILHDAMNGEVIMKIVGIYPQPSDEGDAITIDLESQVEGVGEVVVTDALGREEYRQAINSTFGKSSLALPALRSGYHNLTVRTNGSKRTRGLIVR